MLNGGLPYTMYEVLNYVPKSSHRRHKGKWTLTMVPRVVEFSGLVLLWLTFRTRREWVVKSFHTVNLYEGWTEKILFSFMSSKSSWYSSIIQNELQEIPLWCMPFQTESFYIVLAHFLIRAYFSIFQWYSAHMIFCWYSARFIILETLCYNTTHCNTPQKKTGLEREKRFFVLGGIAAKNSTVFFVFTHRRL